MTGAAVIELPDLPRPEAKKPRRQRAHVDHFRTDDAEHAELAIRARDAGLSVDAYCRLMTLGDPGPRSRRARLSEDGHLTAQHLAAVNRAGSLVNQGIHALNEIALKAPEADNRDRLAGEIMAARALLRTALPALMETLAAVREALARDR